MPILLGLKLSPLYWLLHTHRRQYNKLDLKLDFTASFSILRHDNPRRDRQKVKKTNLCLGFIIIIAQTDGNAQLLKYRHSVEKKCEITRVVAFPFT